MWITGGVSTQASRHETRPSLPEPLVEPPELIQMAIVREVREVRERPRVVTPRSKRRPGAPRPETRPGGPGKARVPGGPAQPRVGGSWFA